LKSNYKVSALLIAMVVLSASFHGRPVMASLEQPGHYYLDRFEVSPEESEQLALKPKLLSVGRRQNNCLCANHK
jgi:hypothetical protein